MLPTFNSKTVSQLTTVQITATQWPAKKEMPLLGMPNLLNENIFFKNGTG